MTGLKLAKCTFVDPSECSNATEFIHQSGKDGGITQVTHVVAEGHSFGTGLDILFVSSEDKNSKLARAEARVVSFFFHFLLTFFLYLFIIEGGARLCLVVFNEELAVRVFDLRLES